jgi:hypothetical protein
VRGGVENKESKMTNKELLDGLSALLKICELKLPLKTGLKIRSMARSLNHLAQDIEAERQKLIEEFALKDDGGKPVIVDVGNGVGRYEFADLAGYSQAYNELMSLPAEGQPAPLKEQELGNLEIEPSVLVLLGDLLVEDSGDNEFI